MGRNNSLSLAATIDAAPWSRFQRQVLALIALAIITDGIATQIFGMAIPAIIRDWHVDHSAFALPTSLGFIGMALGAYGAGLAGDRLGRRWPLILSVGIFGAMTVFSAWAPNLVTLAFLRFASGLGLGGALPNATGLVADITPARKRVFAVSLGVIGMPLGNFLCGLAGAAILPLAGWRALFMIGGGVALAIAALLIVGLPESPRIVLQQKGHGPDLNALLARIGLVVEPEQLQRDQTPTRGEKSILLSPAYRRDTLALWGSYIFTMLCIYTVVSWAPTLLAQKGFQLGLVGLALSAFSAGSTLGGVVLTMLVPRWGSRAPLAITALLGAGVAGLLAFIGFSPAEGILFPIISLATMGFMASGVQNMLYALAAHTYPPHVRASGLGTGLAVGRLGAIASGITGALSLAQGSGAFFGLLASVFIALFVSVLMFENPIPGRHHQSIR